jgi:hypothetical protein
LVRKILNNWMAIRRKSSLRSTERGWKGEVGSMACRRFVECDFNNGRLTEELAELLPPDMRGEDGEDDPADYCARDADGVWRQDPERDRAADPATFRDHVRLLATGGRLGGSAYDLY